MVAALPMARVALGALVSRVEIFMDGHGHGEVFIDGQAVKDVVSVGFEARAGNLNRVTLEVYGKRVLIATTTKPQFAYISEWIDVASHPRKLAPTYFEHNARHA